MNVLNLGCPKYCDGMTCVDINPQDKRVINTDAITYLHHIASYELVNAIYTKNLLEHLTNVGIFVKACYDALEVGGMLTIITDNAAFFPFYLPFWVKHTGIGAHTCNAYALDHCNSIHYSIFTAMHLRNYLESYGFRFIKIKRIWLGARLKAIAVK